MTDILETGKHTLLFLVLFYGIMAWRGPAPTAAPDTSIWPELNNPRAQAALEGLQQAAEAIAAPLPTQAPVRPAAPQYRAAAAPTAAPARAATTAGSAASQALMASAPAPSAMPAEAPATTTRAQFNYTVQRGDTLTGIARRTAVPLQALIAANPGLNPNRIYAGQQINVPGDDQVADYQLAYQQQAASYQQAEPAAAAQAQAAYQQQTNYIPQEALRAAPSSMSQAAYTQAVETAQEQARDSVEAVTGTPVAASQEQQANDYLRSVTPQEQWDELEASGAVTDQRPTPAPTSAPGAMSDQEACALLAAIGQPCE